MEGFEQSVFEVDVSFEDYSQLGIEEMERQKINEANVDAEEDDELDALNDHMLTMKEPRADKVQLARQEQQWLKERAKEGEFPPSSQPFLNIRTPKQFKQVLKSQQIKYNRQQIKFQVHAISNQLGYCSIEVRCHNCIVSDEQKGRKKIIMIKNRKEDFYRIRLFDNKHNHLYHDSMSKRLRKGSGFVELLRKDFESFSKDETIKTFISKMAKKYNQSQERIRKFMYQMKRVNVSFMHISNMASYFKIDFWFKNSGQQQQFYSSEETHMLQGEPQILLLINPINKQRCKKYGEVCFVTFMEFNIRGEEHSKKYDLLLLTGTSWGYILQIFAVMFLQVSHKNVVSVAKLIKYLFDRLGMIPKVIITPSDQYYEHVVAELKRSHRYKGGHFFDPLIQIERIGTTLTKYEDLAYFKLLLQSRTKADYLTNLAKLMQNCKNTPSIRYNLNRVMRKADKMVFGCIQTNQFLGTCFQISGNKMISDIVRQYFLKFTFKLGQQDNGMVDLLNELRGSPSKEVKVYRVKYIRCVKQMMIILNRSNNPSNRHNSNYDYKCYEEVVNIIDMSAIRRNLKANILFVFGEQYGRIFYQNYYYSQDKNGLIVVRIYDKNAMSIFTVAQCPVYNQEGGVEHMGLKCNCLFSFKSGLPCSHQIQASMLTDASLMSSIKKDYICPQIYRKGGRPKRTRRNTQK